MSAETRCGTCKFWRHDRLTEHGFAKCGRIPHDVRGCVDWSKDLLLDYLPESDDWEREQMAMYRRMIGSPAVTQDASGYIAELLTRQDFGCSLWEPLTAPTEASQ